MRYNRQTLSPRERYNKVRGNQDYEISFFTEKMNISRQQVLDAINEVGNNRKKLEDYFKTVTTPVNYYQ